MTSPNTCSQNKFLRGFSLIEILLTLAIFTTIFGLGLFVSMDMYRASTFHSEEQTILNLLERARSLAMSNSYQRPWGVCNDATNTQYVLFSGTTYDANNQNNETFPAQQSTQVSGVPLCSQGGAIFTQLSGTTTPLAITVRQNGRTSVITTNYEGRIDW